MTDFLTYDVFTKHKFSGNPLAIIPHAHGLSSDDMLKVAREYNLSETIFIMPKADNAYKVRIFTPARELPFAGHPTIGASIALARIEMGDYYNGAHQLELIEAAGAVKVTLRMHSTGADYAEFIAPKIPQEKAVGLSHEQVAEILSLAPDDIGFANHEACLFDAGNKFFTFPIKSRAALGRIKIDVAAAARYIKAEIKRSFYCYCLDEKVSFATRMFSLDLGMNEDPATGSAATSFAGTIAKYEALSDGDHKFTLEQGVDMGRPSEIYLSLVIKAGQIEQVRIGGYAVPFSKGELLLDNSTA